MDDEIDGLPPLQRPRTWPIVVAATVIGSLLLGGAAAAIFTEPVILSECDGVCHPFAGELREAGCYCDETRRLHESGDLR